MRNSHPKLNHPLGKTSIEETIILTLDLLCGSELKKLNRNVEYYHT